jgi:hypothetical protein
MTQRIDEEFSRARDKAFGRVIAYIDGRVHQAMPVVVIDLQEKSPETLQTNARSEAWSLFLNGIRHLHNGAPQGQPGSMHEALSRTSLRASPLAAALGVSPPQFEPIYFSIDYTTGAEAALFLCRRLIDAAETDFPKSRTLIQQKILTEKPGVGALKEQMAMSFDVLAGVYEKACGEMKAELEQFNE